MIKSKEYVKYAELISSFAQMPENMQKEHARYEVEHQQALTAIEQTARQQREVLQQQRAKSIAQYSELREAAAQCGLYVLPPKVHPVPTLLIWEDALKNQNECAKVLAEAILQLKKDASARKEEERNARIRKEREKQEALNRAKEEQARRERELREMAEREAHKKEKQKLLFIFAGVGILIITIILFASLT